MPGKCHGFRNDNIVLMKWKTPLVFSQTANGSLPRTTNTPHWRLTPVCTVLLFLCYYFFVEISRLTVNIPMCAITSVRHSIWMNLLPYLTFLHIYLCLCLFIVIELKLIQVFIVYTRVPVTQSKGVTFSFKHLWNTSISC